MAAVVARMAIVEGKGLAATVVVGMCHWDGVEGRYRSVVRCTIPAST